MRRSQYINYQRQAATLARRIFPFIRPGHIEIAGFGLDDGKHLLGLINLFNETFCGKLLISLSGWVCPAHHHLGRKSKKDEGFYVVYGTLVVKTPTGRYKVPAGKTLYMPAGTIHELSAGKEGAVYFEFSERDTRTDVFTDPALQVTRDPEIEEDVPGYKPPSGGFKILGDIGIRLCPHVN